MKSLLYTLFLLLFMAPYPFFSRGNIENQINSFAIVAPAEEVDGVVSKEYKNSIYVIETRKYYVIVELRNGRLYEDDQVRGDLHNYGFKDIQNLKRNMTCRIYVEEYYTSQKDVVNWLRKHKIIN